MGARCIPVGRQLLGLTLLCWLVAPGAALAAAARQTHDQGVSGWGVSGGGVSAGRRNQSSSEDDAWGAVRELIDNFALIPAVHLSVATAQQGVVFEHSKGVSCNSSPRPDGLQTD